MNQLQINNKNKIKRKKIEIEGYVQGIGFRPFVYRLANEYHLTGFTFNQSGKVIIEIQGEEENISFFLKDLELKKPKLSKINSILIIDVPIKKEEKFNIKDSQKINLISSDILADISLCEDCKKELLDFSNRRYLYPFINCTNCGPRYSIIFEHPYDRIHTSMNEFSMCKDCKDEYQNPQDRRFHAEPNSCPNCGPKLFLISKQEYYNNDSFRNNLITDYKYIFNKIIKLLKMGNIIAIKGIGGYHIACDIENSKAIMKLRFRKKRKYKPFAVMFPDIKSIESYCYVDEKEKELLLSYQSPIVLLRLKPNQLIDKNIIPGFQHHLGVFLPYSPLHYLIMHFYKKPLVMTSANFSSEPIIYKEDWDILFQIADYVLYHNRKIVNYCDDSVISKSKNYIIFYRQGRGFTPKSFHFYSQHFIMGLGAELKSTIAITKKDKIILSPYIGDLENIETWKHYIKTMELLKKLYYFNPDYLAVDYHPSYASHRWALENFAKNKIIFIQHHHAHLASCMFENQIQERVLGIALDGTGYGITKHHPFICGAEIYLVDYKSFKHLGSIHPIKLIGGDIATKEIERLAFALVYEVYKKKYDKLTLKDFLSNFYKNFLNSKKIHYFQQMIDKNIQIFEATSCGRLFDGISYLLGLCNESDFEGHPAISLEQILYTSEFPNSNLSDYYPYKIYQNENNFIYYLDWIPIVEKILIDLKEKQDLAKISRKFHNTIVYGLSNILNLIRENVEINKIVLSGGAFQNKYLIDQFNNILKNQNYEVYFHKELSTNDENISFGQVIIANAILST